MTTKPPSVADGVGPEIEAPFTPEEWAFLEACSRRPPRNARQKLREIDAARAARTAELRRRSGGGAR